MPAAIPQMIKSRVIVQWKRWWWSGGGSSGCWWMKVLILVFVKMTNGLRRVDCISSITVWFRCSYVMRWWRWRRWFLLLGLSRS